jgi:hypothetical protein
MCGDVECESDPVENDDQSAVGGGNEIQLLPILQIVVARDRK